jgi:hypothetical protein
MNTRGICAGLCLALAPIPALIAHAEGAVRQALEATRKALVDALKRIFDRL